MLAMESHSYVHCWLCEETYPETYFLPLYDKTGTRAGRRSVCKYCSTASCKPSEDALSAVLNTELKVHVLKVDAQQLLADLSSADNKPRAMELLRQAMELAQALPELRRKHKRSLDALARARTRLSNMAALGRGAGRRDAAPAPRCEEPSPGVYRWFVTCRRCREEKPSTDFYPKAPRGQFSSHPDSRVRECKACICARNRAYAPQRAAKKAARRKQCHLCLELKPYDRFPSKTGKAASASKHCDTCQAEVAHNKLRRKLSVEQKHDALARRADKKAAALGPPLPPPDPPALPPPPPAEAVFEPEEKT